jgi:calcium permeable stress-gated cation channel
MVSRESVYFINLRQAYLLSPYYANRLSSRTVLFTCVPQQVLDERKLRRIFGDTVKNIWIPRETDDLDQLVKERDQTAQRLEKAEIELIKKANVAYQKAIKSGHPDIEVKEHPRDSKEETKEVKIIVSPESPISPLSPDSPREFTRGDGTPILRTNYGFDGPDPGIVGSVAAQWLPAEQRPYHRPIANYGRRVDTIRWTRARLKKLAPKISQLRRQYRKGANAPIPAAFIEFHSLVDAQSAYQTLAHHSANHMRAEIIGVRPHEIIWPSLSFRWWERIIRRFLIQGFIACMVIFWSLPAIGVGMISSIDYLAKNIPFLHWIVLLPKVILGLISGLLPAVALSTLMAAVPMIMRACARQAGIPTESRIELFVQSSYFLFQVVQVFLVTTLTSAASSAITSIIKDPLSARDLLSKNLPTASNFYISYFLLQGLAMSATRIVHLLSIFRHQLMPYAGGRPRLIAAKYHRLRKIHWGAVYPVFTNMAVIGSSPSSLSFYLPANGSKAISYSLIAPIILGVAAIGLSIVYITYKYNLLYVYSSERDTRGLHYPKALTQTLTGLYLSEICLLGLFGLKGAYGPVVMTFGLIIFTSLIHISLNDALSPLLYNLPRTLAAEEELRKLGNDPFLALNLTDAHDSQALDTEDCAEQGYDSDFDPSDPMDLVVDHGEQQSRSGIEIPVEGADKALSLSTRTLSSLIKKKVNKTPIPVFLAAIDFWSAWITPDPNQNPNFIMRWLHPEVFESYHILRDEMPRELRELDPNASYEGSDIVLKDAYAPPSIREKSPRLWIPRDPAGVSRQEVAHSSRVIEISDEGASLDEKGRLGVDLEGETERWVMREGEGARVKF